MTRPLIDPSVAVDVLRATAPDVVAVIRNIRDPNAPAIGEWSAGDVAAHLIDVAVDNLDTARGRGTSFERNIDVRENNARRLAARPQRDPKTLGDAYEEAIGRYLDYLESVDDDPLIPWADLQIPLSALVSADIGELLVHGWDITRAEGQPWKIDPYRAAVAGKGLSPLTVHYVDEEAAAGFTGTFDLRLRGFWALHFVFTDGRLSIEEPDDRRVDAHISADPVAFTLVGYGRVSQWGPTLKGQMLAWGRKPWLALKFGTLLRNP